MGAERGARVGLVRTWAALLLLPPCLWASSVRPPGETRSCGSLSWFPFYSAMVGMVIGEGVVRIQTPGALGAFLRAPALLHGFLPHPSPGGMPALPPLMRWVPLGAVLVSSSLHGALFCSLRGTGRWLLAKCQLDPPLAPPQGVQEGGTFFQNPLMSVSSCGVSWRIPAP